MHIFLVQVQILYNDFYFPKSSNTLQRNSVLNTLLNLEVQHFKSKLALHLCIW